MILLPRAPSFPRDPHDPVDPVDLKSEDYWLSHGQTRLQRLAASPKHIIPGHDPLVMQRYPAASKELDGIAVRLDVEPRE